MPVSLHPVRKITTLPPNARTTNAATDLLPFDDSQILLRIRASRTNSSFFLVLPVRIDAGTIRIETRTNTQYAAQSIGVREESQMLSVGIFSRRPHGLGRIDGDGETKSKSTRNANEGTQCVAQGYAYGCVWCLNLLVPLLFRPNVFPGGLNNGLDAADDEDACCMDDDVRGVPKKLVELCGGCCGCFACVADAVDACVCCCCC